MLFEEILGSTGAEIGLVTPAEYGIDTGMRRFSDITTAVAARGDIALGYQEAPQLPAVLNPPKSKTLAMDEIRHLVCLVHHPAKSPVRVPVGQPS